MLERWFQIAGHQSNLKTEILAGATTFMTMAYIIFVNPDILSDAGLPFGPVMTATILSAALASILMGLLTNYPFALASGMGLNAMFAYTVAPVAGWEAALGVVLISGAAFLILALFGIIDFMDEAIPASLKRATAAGIGLFIAFIGFSNAGIVEAYEGTLVTLGDLTQPEVLLSVIGLVVIALLMARRIKGSILLGILITTVIGMAMGVAPVPQGVGDIIGPPEGLGPIAFQLDLSATLELGFFTIFAFVFVDIFDTMGTLLGTGARAGFLDQRGRLPRIKNAMIVDAIGTAGGALMGTSTVTTYVESTAGVSEGGRTGFTAVVVGALFLLALFLAPLAGLVPQAATAPALIIVGVLMVGGVTHINFEDFTEAFPAFLTIVIMPFAYSIADGIAAGFVAYPLIKLFAGRGSEVHWFVYVLALVAIVHFATV